MTITDTARHDRETLDLDNPFSTRRLRPGAGPFHFGPGQSAERLLRRLEVLGWRAEIVGPHGSGKSALVEVLVEALTRSLPANRQRLQKGRCAAPNESGQVGRIAGDGRSVNEPLPVMRFGLGRGIRQLPSDWVRKLTEVAGRNRVPRPWREVVRRWQYPLARAPWKPAALLVIDGFEQLGWLARRRTIRGVRTRRAGLLVTCHRPTGLLPCLVTMHPEWETLWQLVCRLQAGTTARIEQDDVTGSFVRHAGNFHEILCELYLLHERRRISSRMD
jgi:hypothetical protein